MVYGPDSNESKSLQTISGVLPDLNFSHFTTPDKLDRRSTPKILQKDRSNLSKIGWTSANSDSTYTGQQNRMPAVIDSVMKKMKVEFSRTIDFVKNPALITML